MEKEIIEAVDEEKNSITFKVMAAGDLLEEYKSFKFIFQFIPKVNGSVVHWSLEHDIPDSHALLHLVAEISKDTYMLTFIWKLMQIFKLLLRHDKWNLFFYEKYICWYNQWWSGDFKSLT